MELAIRIPERNKKPGICYAVTNEGVELPVIDVTHPAFALHLSAGELAVRRERFFGTMERRSGTPVFLRRLLFRLFVRRSVLMQGLMKASSGFLSGMNTYLLKIGPDNLGAGYTRKGDRRIAQLYPVLAVRLRLQDTATAIAEGLARILAMKPAVPLHLLNIAGGHAADSLNSLMLVRAREPNLFNGRRVFIHVLDLEKAAPDFGRRALAELQRAGAPLHGLGVSFGYVEYDWSKADGLRSFLSGLESGEKVVALSSEGGLFEYGSDQDIIANLSAFRSGTPGDSFVVGSVTRKEERNWQVRGPRIPVVHRGLPAFASLIKDAGWKIEKAVEGPFSDVVRLARAQGEPPESHGV
jgi:hypothetical protein